MSHIWMQHNEHHGKAEIPTEAADMWALKGWVPCDPPPPDPDPAMAEHQPRFLPTAAELHTEHAALIEAAAPAATASTETEEH